MAKFRDVLLGMFILVFWLIVLSYAHSMPIFDLQKACQPEGQLTCPGWRDA